MTSSRHNTRWRVVAVVAGAAHRHRAHLVVVAGQDAPAVSAEWRRRQGGVDIKGIQHMLRHSSIKVTMDLYTSVAKEVLGDATLKVAGIIPRKPLQRPALPARLASAG